MLFLTALSSSFIGADAYGLHDSCNAEQKAFITLAMQNAQDMAAAGIRAANYPDYSPMGGGRLIDWLFGLGRPGGRKWGAEKVKGKSTRSVQRLATCN